MTSIDLHHYLRTRRSIRRFQPRLVPAPVIERILETATYAPSAHNLQPWRFVILQTNTSKAKLGQALTSKLRADMTAAGAAKPEIESRVKRSLHRLDKAPVAILLCRDVAAIGKDEPEEIIMAIQSVAAAGLQLILAAHAEGLGGNWICWPLYAQESARVALDLPETWEPQGMFFFGYTDEKPKGKPMKEIDDLVVFC